jgi:hypothetical protein
VLPATTALPFGTGSDWVTARLITQPAASTVAPGGRRPGGTTSIGGNTLKTFRT